MNKPTYDLWCSAGSWAAAVAVTMFRRWLQVGPGKRHLWLWSIFEVIAYVSTPVIGKVLGESGGPNEFEPHAFGVAPERLRMTASGPAPTGSGS